MNIYLCVKVNKLLTHFNASRDINSTKRCKQKLNSIIGIFFIFHPILIWFFVKWSSLLDHRKMLLFYLKKGQNSKILHIWKALKQDKCPKYCGSSILLCLTRYCVQQFTVASKGLSSHLFLMYTRSTFSCRHAAFLSCFSSLPFI